MHGLTGAANCASEQRRVTLGSPSPDPIPADPDMNRRFESIRTSALFELVAAPLAVALTVSSLIAAPLPAQKSDAQIADDIEFAMGLAESWGFVDLAGDVLQRIEDAGVPAKTQERLGLAKCDVFATGAFNESALSRRQELFDEALAAYQSFISNNTRSERLLEAETGYVRVSSAYAQTLEIAQEDAIGEAAEALRLRRVEVLTDSVAKSGEVIEKLKGEPETAANKRELVNMMLSRGRMLIALGRSQEDGEFAFSNAFQTLENTVYEAGEGSPGALQAFELIGQCFMAQGDPASAYAFFESVVDTAIPSNLESWNTLVKEQDLDQSAKDQRWLFVQLATPGLLESLQETGEISEANRFAMHFHNTLKREGFQISPGFGYEAYLAVARCLLDSGGWVAGNWNGGDAAWYPDEDAAKAAVSNKRNRYPTTDRALAIAQQINRENKGNRMKVRAQKLIGRIIERPGVKVDPNVLYEAAEGVYNEGEYEVSIYAFKRLLRVLDNEDAALRTEFMPKTLYRIGRAYVRMDRNLEAAMAFREGCTTWQGDPEYDSPNARGFFTLMKDLRSGAGDAPEFAALYTEAEGLAERFASQTDQDEIKWNKAEKLSDSKQWDEAVVKYAEISPSSNYYERALVESAVATYRSGKHSAGEAMLKAYLIDFLNDPVASALGDSEIKAAMRKMARAKGEFYYALAAFNPAKDELKDFEDGKRIAPPAPEVWEEVLARVGDYATEFRDQSGTAPWMMYMDVTANLQLSKLAEARAVYAKMLERYETVQWTGIASVDIYNRLSKLFEQSTDAAKRQQLERDMATLLQTSNGASSPDYAKLRSESNHWMNLGEWADAERALRRLQTGFGEGKRAEEVEKYILPDLAHALLEQQKVSEAYVILNDLMADSEKNPTSKRTLLNWIRSVTGWVEGDSTPLVIVPGVGSTAAEFDEAVSKLNALLNSSADKYSCEAYGLRFQMAWAYYACATAEGGPQLSDRKASARRQLEPLALAPEIGSDFHGVDDRCETDKELKSVYGGGALQARFQWLWDKVKTAQ